METDSQLETLFIDHPDLLIDTWVDRLYDHPKSRYERDDLPELDELCHRGLESFRALIEGKDEPKVIDFVDELVEQEEKLGLEDADLLRFFWEFRTAVTDCMSRGENPGRPDWPTVHREVSRCIETGVNRLVERITA